MFDDIIQEENQEKEHKLAKQKTIVKKQTTGKNLTVA